MTMVWRNLSPARLSLSAKFLIVVVPVFLALSVPGLTLLVNHELRQEHDGLATRIGAAAARAATLLDRHDGVQNQRLARDVLTSLVIDRAFLCAELRIADTAKALVQVPANMGCRGQAEGADLSLPIGVPGAARLFIKFSDAELVYAKTKRRTLALLVVGLSFLFAILAAAIGFRLIVGRPLGQLLSAIRRSTETGVRTPLNNRRKDELGVVMGAFDEMMAWDSKREKALADANAALRDYQAEMKLLNQDLDLRIQARTAELRDREAALVQSERRFRSFAEASSDWFWEMDQNLRFCYFSDRFEDISSVAPEMLLGKTREETGIPDVKPEAWDEHLENLHTKKAFRNFVHPRKMDDGTVIWLSINGKPVFDDQGTFMGYCGTGSDITERRRAEDALALSRNALEVRVTQLETAKRELEKRSTALTELASNLKIARDEAHTANRAKSQFLANMSHEFRTPLNAIIGFSEIIKDESFGPVHNPKYLDYAGDIHNSGQHLLGLINGVLDLSKVESGEDEMHEEAIEVGAVVQSVIGLVQRIADKGAVALRVDLPVDLPEFYADRRKVVQILVNLLANAVKFTKAGGNVTFKAWCSNGSGLVFQVIDTGIGIAPEDIPKAFSKFAQVDNDLDRRYEGTGLGLPLAKGLAEQHGGSLDLQSQLGVGTTVTVRFPSYRIVISKRGGVSLKSSAQSAF